MRMIQVTLRLQHDFNTEGWSASPPDTSHGSYWYIQNECLQHLSASTRFHYNHLNSKTYTKWISGILFFWNGGKPPRERSDENSWNFIILLLLFRRNVWLMNEIFKGLMIQIIVKVKLE